MISVKDVGFGYGEGGFGLRVAELGIDRGERVAVIGPSGTGKTTLLNLLSGILVPASGDLLVEGFNVAKLGVEDRQHLRALKMGLVFQEFELLEYLDVFDNMLLTYRVSPALELDSRARGRARRLADRVGLSDKLRRHPSHLSQGERQRVALCRALVTEPTVILGDEPTGNLDPGNRDLVMDLLFEYSAETQAPLIVVTHDQELTARFERHIDVREFAA